MSGLSLHEVTCLLVRSGMTQSNIIAQKGPSPRTISNITQNPEAKSVAFQPEIDRIAAERLTFPWSPIVGKRIRRIACLREERQITHLNDEFELTVKLAELCLSTQMPHDMSQWDEVDGRLGLHYLLGQYWMTLAMHARADIPRPKLRAKAIGHFHAFADELAAAMETQPAPFTKDVVDILLFKAIGNVVVLEWNATIPKSARATSSTLRARLEKTRYFERLLQYSRIMPKVVTEPFNALAIASTLNMSEYYKELHARLVEADPDFADPNSVGDFDEDFRHFIEWWNKENGE